ncbi:MAG: BREX system ATP-binding domain-containing protein, partial [bacterium]
MSLSPQRQQEVIDALRRGTVPRSSLEAFAVGLDKFEVAIEEDLRKVAAGGSVFKAVRGDYGCGKTFFARWLADRGRKKGFATSEVQISETETPLHRLETVYRK